VNTRARFLLTRFVVSSLLFGIAGAGLVWLLLPVLKGVLGSEIQGEREMVFVSALPSILTITLAAAAALSFSKYGHGAQEDAEDYSFFGAALCWIIFLAVAAGAFAAFALPAIQQALIESRSRASEGHEEAPEAPVLDLREGIRLYYEMRFEAAMEKLGEFLDYDPQNGIALWYSRSAAAEYQNQQKLLQAQSANAEEALFKRGYDHLLERNYLPAIMEFERLVQANPNHILAKEHLDLARRRLQEIQDSGHLEIFSAGLQARLVEHANEGIALYTAGKHSACLKIMEEILLLEPRNPAALRYEQMARREISKHDFLEEEMRALAFIPAYRNILVPIHNGGLLSAARASFIGERLWLSDFWIIRPVNQDGDIQAVGGDMAKLMSTNTLIIHNARIVPRISRGALEDPREGPDEQTAPVLRREASYTSTLGIDLPLAKAAALAYSEGIDLDPVTILRHHDSLYQLGWPDLPLWRVFNRQLTLPFTIFMLGALAAALGWRFRKQHVQRDNTFQLLLSIPMLLAINLFVYTALLRLTDSLNFLLDRLGIAGWALVPVWAALTLFATFFLLGRVMRPQ